MARGRRARRKSSRQSGWGRWVGRGVLVVVLLLVVGVLGGYVWLRNFLGSERFLLMANDRASETLEAEARFSSFDWDGMQVTIPSFEATGENLVRHIELEDMSTEVAFSPLLRKKVETNDIHIRRVHVDLDATKEAPDLSGGNGDTLKFANLIVDELSGRVGLTDGAVKWRGIHADVRRGAARGSYDATLANGTLTTPLALFPDPRLREAKVRYVDGSLFVTKSEWKVYESGRVFTDGEIDLRDGRYIFNSSMKNVLCEEILPDDWKKQLRGTVSSDFTVEGQGREAPVITGDLNLVGGLLTALPVLDSIAAYTDTERFRRLNLRKASLHYRQKGDRLELTKIELASEGLVRLEGKLVIEAGQLDGLFQLGLTPGTLATIPGAEAKVFTPGKSGMVWTPLRITGTVDTPQEDLSNRLIAAAGERLFEMVGGELVLKHSGRAAGALAKGILDRAGNVTEAGLKVLEDGPENLIQQGTDTVRGGVGSVLNGIFGTGRTPMRPDPPRTPEEKARDKEKELQEAGTNVEEQSRKSAQEEAQKAVDETEGDSLQEKAEKLIEEEFGP